MGVGPSGTLYGSHATAGYWVHEDPRSRRRTNLEPTVSASNEPPPGHKREETEGVFVLQDGKAVFTAVKIGIAGEQYFEVVEGLKAGDRVITGPFASVRELADGAQVKLQQESRRSTISRSTDRQ